MEKLHCICTRTSHDMGVSTWLRLTLFVGIRWCVMGTRLLINTAYGVDWVGLVNGTMSKMNLRG